MKIICCRTGQCLKVLSGHRRTPWVVRFHPTQPQLLASGSLDYEARGLPLLPLCTPCLHVSGKVTYMPVNGNDWMCLPWALVESSDAGPGAIISWM